jgi:hypothetical protein
MKVEIHTLAEERGRLDGLRDKQDNAVSYAPLGNIVWGKNVVEWLYDMADEPEDELLNNLCDEYCDAYRQATKVW